MLFRILLALSAVSVLAACDPTVGGNTSSTPGASAQAGDSGGQTRSRNFRMSGSRAGAR